MFIHVNLLFSNLETHAEETYVASREHSLSRLSRGMIFTRVCSRCRFEILASFSGCLPLCFLDCIRDEPPGEAGEGLVQPVCHQTARWTWSWCNVDSVSVIMATCPHTRMAIDSKRHQTTRLLFQFIAMTQKTAPEMPSEQ